MAGSRRFADREGDFRVVLGRFMQPDKRVDRWFFAFYALLSIGMAALMFAWPTGTDFLGEEGGFESEQVWAGVLAGVTLLAGPFVLAVGAAVRLKAREIRLGHESDILYVEHYKLHLERQFKIKQMKLEEERDEWQDKKEAELYEAILDQVERGSLKPRNEDPGDSYDFPNRDR